MACESIFKKNIYFVCVWASTARIQITVNWIVNVLEDGGKRSISFTCSSVITGIRLVHCNKE